MFRYSSLPVYSVNNVVITHKDETFLPQELADLASLDRSVVGAYFGTSSVKFLPKQEGVRVMDNITTLADALSKVATRQVRYFYYHDLGLRWMRSPVIAFWTLLISSIFPCSVS